MPPSHLRYLVALVFCIALSVLTASPAQAAPVEEPVILPPFKVEGRFSELICGARFRYHVPGGKLKALVVRKMPKSWRDAGVKKGDQVIQIDELPINGTGLPTLAKFLDAKSGGEETTFVFVVEAARSGQISKLETRFEKDSAAFTIAYP